MRTKNSIYNASTSLISNIISLIFGFVVQSIFIKRLGLEYSGINGLFGNILQMLSIAELGIGSAIVFHLYKPIAESNTKQVNLLMIFYKKCYIVIALVILVAGSILIPFIPGIVGVNSIKENLYLIYILFLGDVVFSYFMTYKRSLLHAYQKDYIINIFHILYLIISNVLQILILVYLKNYILYLITKILFKLIENISITLYVNFKYRELNTKTNDKLDPDLKKDIGTKVKGLIYHKFGGFFLTGTNNMVISLFLGITTVGLYHTYYLIINSISILLRQIFSSLTASVGNLLVLETKENKLIVYKKIFFLNYFIYSIFTVGLLLCTQSFISFYLGKEYLLTFFTLIVLCIDFYFQGIRQSIGVFKSASGIFYEDRFMPIIEVIINLIISLIFVNLLGLPGIFLGTIGGTIFIFIFNYPKYAYNPIFDRPKKEFIISHLKYFVLLIAQSLVCFLILHFIRLESSLLTFLVNGFISVFIVCFTNILIFGKTEEYDYFKKLIGKLFSKRKNKEIKG